MSDVVERLRGAYHAWNNPPSDALPKGAGAVLEAADEIERLNENLRRCDVDLSHSDALLEKAEAEIERLRERVHYAEGTADANIARANEACNAALEEAAKVADASREKADDDLASERDYDERNRLETYVWACTQLAAAIRALKEKS